MAAGEAKPSEGKLASEEGDNDEEEILQEAKSPVEGKRANHFNRKYHELLEIVEKMNEYNWIEQVWGQIKNAPSI